MMEYPHSVRFKVSTCTFNDIYSYEIKGIVIDKSDVGSQCGHKTSKINRIKGGFLWPLIGWDIISMPGFGKDVEMTYVNQEVPGPQKAWVEKGVGIADIILDKCRPTTEPLADDGPMRTESG